jgi:hypothetical protein
MIKVYAFEPEAILNPVLSNALEQFGFHHGRIIGAVPREWGEKVKEIWRSNRNDKALEVRLERLKKNNVIQRIPLSGGEEHAWIERACSLDTEYVQGIIASDAESARDKRVIGENDLHDDCAAWYVETGVFVSRSAKTMASLATVLLRYSSDVKFIDAHYAGEPRHTDFIKECLHIREQWDRCETSLLEIHFLHSFDSRDHRSDAEKAEDARRVFEGVVEKTSMALRDTYRHHETIRLFQWSNQNATSRFHERFLLTDRAAIDFGGGLDRGRETERTSAKLLSPRTTDELKTIYVEDAKVFTLLNTTTIQIAG